MEWAFNVFKIIYSINDLYVVNIRRTKIITAYIPYLYLVIQRKCVYQEFFNNIFKEGQLANDLCLS